MGFPKRVSNYSCLVFSYEKASEIGENRVTSVEEPMNRSLGFNIFIIPNEINFLPDIAKEAVDMALPEIFGSIEPIGSENTDLKLSRRASLGGI